MSLQSAAGCSVESSGRLLCLFSQRISVTAFSLVARNLQFSSHAPMFPGYVCIEDRRVCHEMGEGNR